MRAITSRDAGHATAYEINAQADEINVRDAEMGPHLVTSRDAVVAGHICLDVIPDLSALSQEGLALLFRPGRLTEVGSLTISTGGAVSNTGLALHKLGIPTRLMGKIGNDLLGQVVRQVIESHGPGLANGMVVDPAVHTSYTVIINPPGVDRIFLHCPAANETFSARDVRYDVVGRARLFHFGYPPILKLMYEDGGAQLVDMFRRARETGVTTSLDLSLPDAASAAGRVDWAAILRAVLPYVDVFLPSIEETLYMLRRETYRELVQAAGGADFLRLITPELLSDLGGQILALGSKVVGLKLGERGLYVRTAGRDAIAALGAARPAHPAAWANRELWAPCFQVQVVGTTGAGDSTIAGFLSGLLRGLSLEDTVTAAVAVGACNVEAADALGGIRSWEETWRRVRAGWPRHDLRLDAPGWHFDDQHQMWVGPAV
jgi:sugar/nucleoside kinase (ribokinase family)